MTQNATGEIIVRDDYQEKMRDVLQRYDKAKKTNALLLLTFTTVTEYLWNLKEIAMLMRPLGPAGLFYLAAAVSDFFLPEDRLEEHKIQSSEPNPTSENSELSRVASRSKSLVIDLEPVPKFLKTLVDGWAPQGMIVSFKLETDPSILVSKAQKSLDRYSHHLVIGNLLSTRKYEVVFISHDAPAKRVQVPLHRRLKSGSELSNTLHRPDKASLKASDAPDDFQAVTENEESGVEIESLIVPEVVKMHNAFLEAA